MSTMKEAMHEGQAIGLPLAAVTQEITVRNDGMGAVGDCIRAALASLLGLNVLMVPNFVRYGLDADAPDSHGWWWALVGFCDSLEPSHEVIVVDEPPPPSDNLEDLFGMYLAAGKSPRGDLQHMVVCRGGEIIWDPHPSRMGIDGAPKEMYVVRRRRKLMEITPHRRRLMLGESPSAIAPMPVAADLLARLSMDER